MDAISLSPNAMLIQGATMNDLESMMSRLLDKKLADIYRIYSQSRRRS